jgi:hypothetical protein
MAKVDERSEREKLIAKHLRIFQLPEDTVRQISLRMEAYVTEHLCPVLKYVDCSEFSGFNPEQIMKIQQLVSDFHDEIVRFKDAIFFERLMLEVLLVDPYAFSRIRSGPESAPIQ